MPGRRGRRSAPEAQLPAEAAAASAAREASLAARLLDCLARSRDPLTVAELRMRLGLDAGAEDEVRVRLERLERRGVVAAHRRGRWSSRSRLHPVVGRLQLTRSGDGFVEPVMGVGPALHVPRRRLSGADHGDWVVARRAGGGARGVRSTETREGEVVAVIARRPRLALGLRQAGPEGVRVKPRDGRLGEGMRAALDGRREDRAAAEDVVWAELPPSAAAGVEATARIVEVMGPSDSPAVARAAIGRLFDLPGPFPDEALREASARGREVDPVELRGREDFTGGTVLTIDPPDARDHDDAVELAVRAGAPGPRWLLTVHIADVARYVPPGGEVDREALRRGASVYLPGEVIPMLPPALSAGLCSLLPGRTRLVQSVSLEFDGAGRRNSVRFADGFIRAAALLSYEEAEALLASRSEDVAGRTLREMDALARRLRSRRTARGSLDLDLPEVELRLDDAGRPAAVRARPRGRADALIEEFMIAANAAVASWLAVAVRPALYRVHEEPDADAIEALEEDLRELGVPVSGARRPLALRVASILEQARGRPEERAIALMVLRRMKLARYSDAPLAHFGLALARYTHFTSPIRRYPDLVVHRLLREARGRRGALPRRARGRGGAAAAPRPAEAERLPDIALECSRLERRAEDAERAMVSWMAAIYMRGRIGDSLPAVVTGMGRGVARLTLEGLGVEGTALLPDRPAARAARPPPRLGARVTARVTGVDPLRGRIDLAI